MDNLPLLSLLFLTLPVGALLAWLWPHPQAARVIALGVALFDLAVALAVVAVFDPGQSGFQLVERYAWIPSLNIHYAVGVDGLSVLFLPATVLLFVGAILASWNSVHTLPRLYYSLLLLLETATLGAFCALDTMLFFLFWELALVPLYFLVGLWGLGANRRHAAMKYTLVMLASGLPLLFGFIVLAGPNLVFDLPTLLAAPPARDVQMLVFLLLFAGFAAKIPVVPLHTWLPLIALEGPAAVAALLTGIKLGVYGLIRFAAPLAPAAAQELHWLLAGLGVVAILFGAFAALAQTNLRRMLGYASLSHVGLVLLAVAAFSVQGIQGAILLLLNFVLAAGGLFLLVGALHHRTGSTDIAHLGGAAQTMPVLASCFLLFGFAAMGIPGTLGFPAELLILLAAFQTHAGAALAALTGMVLGAAYFLSLYRRSFFGPATRPEILQAPDLLPRERWIALLFAALILAFGVFPGLLLDAIRPAAEIWAARFG